MRRCKWVNLNNKLYIDGRKIKDRYNSVNQEDFIKNLDKDEYFVMGDNRGDSLDSRIVGPIDKKDIMGNSEFMIFPCSRFGKAK